VIEGFAGDVELLKRLSDGNIRIGEHLKVVDELQRALDLGIDDSGPLTACSQAAARAVIDPQIDGRFQYMHGQSIEAQINAKMRSAVDATRSCLVTCKGEDCVQARTRQQESRTLLQDHAVQLKHQESAARGRKSTYRLRRTSAK
jgi:hypothetical protein